DLVGGLKAQAQPQLLESVQAGNKIGAKPLPPLPEEVEDEIVEVDPAAFRPRSAKVRRRYLRGVNVGLALHYVAPFLFQLGTGSGVIGMLMAMNGAIHD